MPYFWVFFKARKLTIFGRFQPKVEVHFLATFLHPYVVIVILNVHVKDYFHRLNRLSMRVI